MIGNILKVMKKEKITIPTLILWSKTIGLRIHKQDFLDVIEDEGGAGVRRTLCETLVKGDTESIVVDLSCIHF